MKLAAKDLQLLGCTDPKESKPNKIKHPYYIPFKDRINALMLGAIGHGKSSIMNTMVYQDIKHNRGFLFIDNHGGAKEVLRMIPPSKRDKLIYINPMTAQKHDYTLKFNPLQVEEGQDITLSAGQFTNALKKSLGGDSNWGTRIDATIREGAVAVMSTESNTLRSLLSLTTNEEFRHNFLPMINNKQARDFFGENYDSVGKEASSTIYTRIGKMLGFAALDAMFNTKESTITFKKMMEDNMFIVIDLSDEIPEDYVLFFGNIFLYMFYVAYRRRVMLKEENRDDQFSIYIDEAHMYAEEMLSELLNTVRKYGVKMNIATQSIGNFDKEFQSKLGIYFNTLIMFQCESIDANHFKNKIATSVDQIQVLPKFHFSFYNASKDKVRKHVIRTVDLNNNIINVYDWEKAEEYCIKKWGKRVNLSLYNKPEDKVKIKPLAFGIMNYIYQKKTGYVEKEELINATMSRYNSSKRDIEDDIADVLGTANMYIEESIEQDENDRIFKIYKLTDKGIKDIFSKSVIGRRGGGELHTNTIFRIMDQYTAQYYCYCDPDLAKTNEDKADLLIYNPRRVKDKKGEIKLDGNEWSDQVIAVEVETDPGKHMNPDKDDDQIYKNFSKNHELGYKVWFVVYTDKNRQQVIAALSDQGVSKSDYEVLVYDKDALFDESGKHRTDIEMAIMGFIVLDNKYTTQQMIDNITNIMDVPESDVKYALHHLEQVKSIKLEERDGHQVWISTSIKDVVDESYVHGPRQKRLQRQVENDAINVNDLMNKYKKLSKGTPDDIKQSIVIKEMLESFGYKITIGERSTYIEKVQD